MTGARIIDRNSDSGTRFGEFAAFCAVSAARQDGFKDQRMTRRNGFTLIELLTIGIITLLISMAVPSMQTFTQNSRQTAAVNDLISGMHLARNTAITTNSRVTVCPSGNGTSCQSVTWDQGFIAFVDRDSDQTVDGDEAIIRSGDAKDAMTISSAEFSDYLMYRPNGRAMRATVGENTGRFSACDNRGSAHAKMIQIDLSGRARVIDARDDGISVSCY
jgi:type IV fimbrial biogenesis protein FimT